MQTITRISPYTEQRPSIFRRTISRGSQDRIVTRQPASPANTVGKILTTHPLPRHAILLGQCSDGLPFLLGLDDPQIGSTLITCDAGCGKTHQLQVIADSACRTHTPAELQLAVLTLNPDEWRNLSIDSEMKKSSLGCFAWYDPNAELLIENLTRRAEIRREGGSQRPDILFLLDDFAAVEDLSLEAQVNLHWLLTYGAQSGVWLLATMNTHQSNHFPYWLEIFRSSIFGRITASQGWQSPALPDTSPLKSLLPGAFQVFSEDRWWTYTLPALGD